MKPMTDFHGIFPAAMTMFDATGNLDEKATWNHADWLIRQGVHGLVAAGTSGEFIALDDDERRRVIEIVQDAAGDRVPVLAGTGYYSTRKTVATTQWAQDLGVSAALVILPYYMKPPKSAILEHYRILRQNTDLPIFVYNNPAYAGCAELTPWDLAELAQEGVIHGVKSTFATTSPVVDLSLLCPPDFRIFYGSFREGLQGLLAGAHGWISGILNFLPDLAVKLYQTCVVEQDVQSARRVWKLIVPFVQLYYRAPFGSVPDLSLWRAGLQLRGQHGGYSRLPFFPATQQQCQSLADVMAKTGLITNEFSN